MKAIKNNKIYTVTTKEEAESYRLRGFDIIDDDGKTISHGAGKTVSYDNYAAVLAENERLKSQIQEIEQSKQDKNGKK